MQVFDYAIIGNGSKTEVLISQYLNQGCKVLWLNWDEQVQIEKNKTNEPFPLLMDPELLNHFTTTSQTTFLKHLQTLNQSYLGLDRKIKPSAELSQFWQFVPKNVALQKHPLISSSPMGVYCWDKIKLRELMQAKKAAQQLCEINLVDLQDFSAQLTSQNEWNIQVQQQSFQVKQMGSCYELAQHEVLIHKLKPIEQQLLNVPAPNKSYGVLELVLNHEPNYPISPGRYVLGSPYPYRHQIKILKSVLDPKFLQQLKASKEVILGAVYHYDSQLQSYWHILLSEEDCLNPVIMEVKLKMMQKTLKGYFADIASTFKTGSIRLSKNYLFESNTAQSPSSTAQVQTSTNSFLIPTFSEFHITRNNPPSHTTCHEIFWSNLNSQLGPTNTTH